MKKIPLLRNKTFRLILVAGLALSLVLGVFQPARADGPIISGYTLQNGTRVPAPAGYVQTTVFRGEEQACGAFKAPLDLFLDSATGNLLVADTGNNRVVELDANGKFLLEIGGDKAGLKGPEGVFVDSQGNIWVADRGNQRVVAFNADGSFKFELSRPDSSYLEGVDFSPSKIVVDRRGYVYIVIGNQNNLGVIVVDSTQRFRGFFGRTKIPFSLGRLIARALASDTQRHKMLSIQPAPLSNINLDALGFIYAVSPVLRKDQIQRLNSVGTNVYGEVGTRTGAGKLWDKLLGKEGIVFGEADLAWTWNGSMGMSVPEQLLPQFVDLAVDSLGIVSVIDGRNSQIYQYDQAGNLLTIFGGPGSSEGFFQKPVSIAAGQDGLLYILDSGRSNIQVFRPTELTLMVHQASFEYFNGDYDKAAQLWGDIAQRDTNFSLAHSGLGKALVGKEQYRAAMQEYFYAENKEGYSAAFREYRQIWLRATFGWLGMVVIVAVAAAGLTWGQTTRGLRRLVVWLKTIREQAGLWAVPVLIVLAVTSWMFSLSALSFHFSTKRPEEIRVLIEGGKILIPWVTWCIALYGVGEIFFGEGTFRQVLIGSAWALWPLIVFAVPVNLLTHVLSLDEKSVYTYAWYVIWALLIWEFLSMVREVHNFEFGQAVFVSILSLVGMALVWIFVGLVYALTAEIFRFIGQLILEVYVRFY